MILFLIDGSNEITVEDYNCASFLRKHKKKVVLVVNKVELKQSKNYKQNFGLRYMSFKYSAHEKREFS